MSLPQIDLTGDGQPSPFDFAQALSVAEACAVLFGQRLIEMTGAQAEGLSLISDPTTALRVLQSAASDTCGNPRTRGAAAHALSAFFGLDVALHPELLVQGPAALLPRA